MRGNQTHFVMLQIECQIMVSTEHATRYGPKPKNEQGCPQVLMWERYTCDVILKFEVPNFFGEGIF